MSIADQMHHYRHDLYKKANDKLKKGEILSDEEIQKLKEYKIILFNKQAYYEEDLNEIVKEQMRDIYLDQIYQDWLKETEE